MNRATFLLYLVCACAVVILVLSTAAAPAYANALNLAALRPRADTHAPDRFLADGPTAEIVRAAQVRLELARGNRAAALDQAAHLRPLRCDLAINLGNAAAADAADAADARAMAFWRDCPQIAAYFVRRGDDALALGDMATAELWYKRATDLPTADYNISIALLKYAQLLSQRDWDLGLKVYERYRTAVVEGALPPLEFDIATLRATDLWQLLDVGHRLRLADGSCVRATFWYELANQRSPYSEYPAVYLGVCADDAAAQVEWFRAAIERNPGNGRGYFWLGLTLKQAGECEAARKFLQRADALENTQRASVLTADCRQSPAGTPSLLGAWADNLDLHQD